VVSYLVLLHLFVLAMLYYMSSSESPEVNMALLAPLAAPAAASPVIESRVEAIASSVADAAGTLSQAVSSLGKLGASSSD
jgi:predicted MFS family arabinose efflux permease